MRSLPAAAAILLTATLAACAPALGTTSDGTAASGPPATPAAVVPADVAPESVEAETTPLAIDVLATLPVKGRAPGTGYQRNKFGQAWADADRNGCDTRNDVLRRDLTRMTIKPGTNGCKVTAGKLWDPYSGTRIDLADIQVDHLVALYDAWQKGAQQLSDAERLAFANDPLNLQPTTAALNQQKSSSDAASWLPPEKGYRCAYVARQVAVKAKYELWVTQAEHDIIVRILADCPSQPAPGELPTPALAGDQPEPVDVPAASIPSTPESDVPGSNVAGSNVAGSDASEPSAPEPVASPVSPPAGQAGCDPAYPGVCIPRFDVVGDLDCGQISERRFQVLPPDPHKFDRDRDGVGCESG